MNSLTLDQNLKKADSNLAKILKDLIIEEASELELWPRVYVGKSIKGIDLAVSEDGIMLHIDNVDSPRKKDTRWVILLRTGIYVFSRTPYEVCIPLLPVAKHGLYYKTHCPDWNSRIEVEEAYFNHGTLAVQRIHLLNP